MQRHELVELPTRPSMDRLIQILDDRFIGLGNYPESRSYEFMRYDDIHVSLEMAALYNLGFDVPSPEDRCQAGFDCALDFFLSDWWKQSGDRPPEQIWYDAFTNGLVLGLVASRPDDVVRLCSWLDHDLEADVVPFDPSRNGEIADVYKVLAAHWCNTQESELFTKSMGVIQSSKDRAIKALSRMIEAGFAKDQSMLDEAVEASLKITSRKVRGFDPEDSRIADRLGRHESAVVLTCTQLWGLSEPQLEPKLDALLLKPTPWKN